MMAHIHYQEIENGKLVRLRIYSDVPPMVKRSSQSPNALAA
jgi:hypothetical protein